MLKRCCLPPEQSPSSQDTRRYCVRLDADRIQLTKLTNGIPTKLLTYLRASMVEPREVTFQEISIVKKDPKSRNHEDVLFHLRFQSRLVPISRRDIARFDELAYWCGFYSDDTGATESLSKADWELEQVKEKPYFKVNGERSVTRRPFPRIAFGLYDVLPKKVLDIANEKKWRIVVGKSSKRVTDPQIYTNVSLANRLMNIPVTFYEVDVKSSKEVERSWFDIRELENIFPLFMHGEKHFGKHRACRSPLDLFDSMLAFSETFSIEQDVIFLPCLPRPCAHSKVIPCRFLSPPSSKRLVDNLGLLANESLHTLQREMFPLDGSEKTKDETYKRLNTSHYNNSPYDSGLFSPGKIFTVPGGTFSTIPRAVDF